MTYLDLIDEFKSLGFPTSYGSFKSAVTPPYIAINSTNNNDFMADNINYKDIEGYQVELYTAIKHPPTENLVQDKLKELGIPYSKIGPLPIESENLYQTIYEVQLI
ncbi:hypothetical protein [Orenia marismortui]|uniref:Uncharacterized protein n=1 Tax=Orenia marismortui TaxID=46469 RepID=A0A4V3GYF5_9FIRM|nr:hypothetical protein [Orenia marismortui]TDX52140.1 hypothetical protein C7959_10862 [Orenia marismortui]